MKARFVQWAGNGADDRQIDVTIGQGETIKAVLVKRLGAVATFQFGVMRFDSMPDGYSKECDQNSALQLTRIKGFNASGFVVGTHAQVNASGQSYLAIALIDDGKSDVATGSYTNPSPKTVSFTPAFVPAVVCICSDVAARQMILKTDTMAANGALPTSGTVGTNYVTAWASGSFTVGTSPNVFNTTDAYYFLALKASAPDFGTFSYTAPAVAVDDTDVPISGLGGQIDGVLVKAEAAQRIQIRTKLQTGDVSASIGQQLDGANRVQSLGTNSIQIGTDATVQTASAVHHGLAFRDTPSVPVGGGGGSGGGTTIGGSSFRLTSSPKLAGPNIRRAFSPRLDASPVLAAASAPLDTRAPAISSVSVPGASISNTGANVQATVVDPEGSRVRVQVRLWPTADAEGGATTLLSDWTPFQAGGVVVRGVATNGVALSPGVGYSGRVIAQDESFNTRTDTSTFTFTTATATATPTPALVGSPTATSLTSSSERIHSVTDIPSTRQIKYWVTASGESSATLTTEQTSAVTAQDTDLSGLNASTGYSYRVIARNGTQVLTSSTVYTFTTAASAGGTGTGGVAGLTQMAFDTAFVTTANPSAPVLTSAEGVQATMRTISATLPFSGDDDGDSQAYHSMESTLVWVQTTGAAQGATSIPLASAFPTPLPSGTPLIFFNVTARTHVAVTLSAPVATGDTSLTVSPTSGAIANGDEMGVDVPTAWVATTGASSGATSLPVTPTRMPIKAPCAVVAYDVANNAIYRAVVSSDALIGATSLSVSALASDIPSGCMIAVTSSQYRKVGDTNWRMGLGGSSIRSGTDRMFVWDFLECDPNTAYEGRVTIVDAGGAEHQTFTWTATTRADDIISAAAFQALADRYIDRVNGDDAWDGTSPTHTGGTTGPIQSLRQYVINSNTSPGHVWRIADGPYTAPPTTSDLSNPVAGLMQKTGLVAENLAVTPRTPTTLGGESWDLPVPAGTARVTVEPRCDDGGSWVTAPTHVGNADLVGTADVAEGHGSVAAVNDLGATLNGRRIRPWAQVSIPDSGGTLRTVWQWQGAPTFSIPAGEFSAHYDATRQGRGKKLPCWRHFAADSGSGYVNGETNTLAGWLTEMFTSPYYYRWGMWTDGATPSAIYLRMPPDDNLIDQDPNDLYIWIDKRGGPSGNSGYGLKVLGGTDSRICGLEWKTDVGILHLGPTTRLIVDCNYFGNGVEGYWATGMATASVPVDTVVQDNYGNYGGVWQYPNVVHPTDGTVWPIPWNFIKRNPGFAKFSCETSMINVASIGRRAIVRRNLLEGGFDFVNTYCKGYHRDCQRDLDVTDNVARYFTDDFADVAWVNFNQRYWHNRTEHCLDPFSMAKAGRGPVYWWRHVSWQHGGHGTGMDLGGVNNVGTTRSNHPGGSLIKFGGDGGVKPDAPMYTFHLTDWTNIATALNGTVPKTAPGPNKQGGGSYAQADRFRFMNNIIRVTGKILQPGTDVEDSVNSKGVLNRSTLHQQPDHHKDDYNDYTTTTSPATGSNVIEGVETQINNNVDAYQRELGVGDHINRRITSNRTTAGFTQTPDALLRDVTTGDLRLLALGSPGLSGYGLPLPNFDGVDQIGSEPPDLGYQP